MIQIYDATINEIWDDAVEGDEMTGTCSMLRRCRMHAKSENLQDETIWDSSSSA
jgi:hypothetical protein